MSERGSNRAGSKWLFKFARLRGGMYRCLPARVLFVVPLLACSRDCFSWPGLRLIPRGEVKAEGPFFSCDGFSSFCRGPAGSSLRFYDPTENGLSFFVVSRGLFVLNSHARLSLLHSFFIF